VSFEAILNALWLATGLCALGALAWGEPRRAHSGPKARARRLLAVLFAIVFLFPCVSESDDLMTLAALPSPPGTRGEMGNPLPPDPGGDKSAVHLERFFESLQTLRIPAQCGLLLTLLLMALIACPGARASERWLTVASGRAPPPAY
jgi:hypothetical protein